MSGEIFKRLVNAVLDRRERLDSYAYWRMLPDADEAALREADDYDPELWWVIGVCDEIGVDFEYVLRGDMMALSSPVDPAQVAEARAMNSVADGEGWSYSQRLAAQEFAHGQLAARSSSVVDVPLGEADWRAVGKLLQPPAEQAQAALPLHTCKRHDGVFYDPQCPDCRSNEYVDYLE